MKSHLRIFVSSTMDLKEERNSVNDVVNQIEGIPIRMELFTARSQSPEEVCMEELSKCDLYVGIFSKRYGFIPNAGNPRKLSATAIEFEKARELEIPTLIFVRKDGDREPELEKFLNRISDFKKGIFRKTFDGIDDLKYWVLASLVFHLLKKTSIPQERDKLEKLVMDESVYRHFAEKACEYVDLKGIYQLRRVVQLKLADIYVPLKLRELITLQEKSLEISYREMMEFSGVEMASPLRFGFFPLYTRTYPRDHTTTSSVDSEMDLREILSVNKKIAILGGPGSGKTTIFRHLTGTFIRENDSGLTPFLLPLREYGRYLKSEPDLSILSYIKKYFRGHGLQLPQEFYERHLSSGGCVVMLDGLDEILNERGRINAASRIEEFAACFSEGNTIIISSRIPAYRSVQLSGFDHYTIQKLNHNQISNFMSRWFEIVEGIKGSDESRRLISLIINDTMLLSLSMNPLMLSLICLVGLQGIAIPRNRADLYDICVKTLVSSWETRKGFKGVLSEPQRFEVLKRLAYFFLEKKKITATDYEILSFIEQSLKRASLSENERRDQARALLKNMTERAGLLIEREPKVYGFIHLGLRDYLAALHLAGADNIKEMFHSLLLPKLHSVNYEHVICLCSRCLTHQSISRAIILLNEILDAKTPYENYTHLDLALATKCLFNSGISYGEPSREILAKAASVLKSGSYSERNIMMATFEEIHIELFESFLRTLVNELETGVAIELVLMLAYEGIIPEESEFSDIALELLDHEIMAESGFAHEASRALGVWAARESKKALKLSIKIIEEGVEEAENCAKFVVPIASRDPNVMNTMLQIIDDKGSRMREYLLSALYRIAPDRIIEKSTSIIEDKDEDPELRKVAAAIQKYRKITEEEASSLAHEISADLMKSLFQRKDITAVTDDEAVGLIFVGTPSEQELLKRLNQLPKIFEANRILAFRLLQLFNDYTDTYSTLAGKVKNFARYLSEEKTSTNRRLLAYTMSEIRMLEIGKNILVLVELAEDKEEFAVARRAAINRLFDTATSKEQYARLRRLSSDKEINENLFFLLSKYDFDRSDLVQAVLKEVERGQTRLIGILNDLIRRNYE